MSCFSRALALVFFMVLSQGLAASASAQGRAFSLRYTPSARVQLAVWVERADGTFVGTVRLTEAVAYRGIGNRPGATQMNSGFRWPYGRRESVFPIWAHRRASAPGAEQFRRVIFQNRTTEGHASRSSSDYSQDDYFCLSFNAAAADELDAISCASVFNSDKGRFITSTDVQGGYSEPWQSAPMVEGTRTLSLESLYPPRRDVFVRAGFDHVDVESFRADAQRVMPELDAITMATAPAQAPQLIQFTVPDAWPDGNYVLHVEANVERDHNATYSQAAYPIPQSEIYDYWAKEYGFAYRGQPSVVYAVPFVLSSAGGVYVATTPIGYSDVNGQDGVLRPLDASITNDPTGKPGSGADRLRALGAAPRLTLTVLDTAVCAAPEPPPECEMSCTTDDVCPGNFLCGVGGTCVGYCEASTAPLAPIGLAVTNHPDSKRSHEWARLTFTAPVSRRSVTRYEVRVSATPITSEAEFLAAVNAKAATSEIQAVAVCDAFGGADACPAPGAQVSVDIGWLTRLSTYHVAVRAYDGCNAVGPIGTAVVETTDIDFTTVSPCFVATAAYGSPLAEDVTRLRGFRDRYLLTNGPGRAFVAAYYTAGPYFAAFIRGHESRRALARTMLSPFVALARSLDAGSASE